jgi:alpha-beta hydrolase superfamily lysophospholipase
MSRRFTVPPGIPLTDITLRAPAGVELPAVETVWFRAIDGFQLNFRRLRPVAGVAPRGPVMMVHGSGTRANLFCPPSIVTLPAMLSAAGFDVWMLNWRASIDLEPSQYTFDDGAVFDFPAAVATIHAETGSETVKAVVHCQGSHAFMMSIASGLLPSVTRVVANSTAMTPTVRRAARIKLPIALETLGKFMDYFNPQYALYAPSFGAKLMDFMVHLTHHECRNAVCKHSSFVYGVGFPTLWSHHNLDDATHDWIAGEFAHVPVSLFRQTHDCLVAGHLVPAKDYSEIPEQLGVQAPMTDAVFTFITGSDNHTFRPIGMRNSCDFFNEHSPVPPGAAPKHGFKEFPGYGHLDMFLGQYASVDVFPHVIGWLSEDP